jgi:two-component system chemotaxis sensor kinase CheA
MDVVKRSVERLRGTVAVQSQPGHGTTVRLSIPLTLVIIEGLLVRLGCSAYVIALGQVLECVDLTPEICAGGTMIALREETIPVLSLREVLGLPGVEDRPRLVIVDSDGIRLALKVDAVLGRQQVVIKPLSAAVKQIRVLSGATILGDGSVALILDVAELVKIKALQNV